MRCLMIGFAVALMMMAGASANALESSAGSDNVNTSQVGLDAKINATNAITTQALNRILSCGKAGQLYDSVHDVCVEVTERLAQKIADCSKSNEFYNQDTDGCQSLSIPPDSTATVNSMQSALNAMLNCNKTQKFYDQASNSCVGPKLVSAWTGSYSISLTNTAKSVSVKGYDLCVISKNETWSSGRGGCTVSGTPKGTWTLVTQSWKDSANTCNFTCYNLQ